MYSGASFGEWLHDGSGMAGLSLLLLTDELAVVDATVEVACGMDSVRPVMWPGKDL